jgi:hypothetical protein
MSVGMPRMVPLSAASRKSLSPTQEEQARLFALAYHAEVALRDAPNPLVPTLEPVRRRLRG